MDAPTGVDPREAIEAAVWDDVIGLCQAAWPGRTLGWGISPGELITEIIDERDAYREAVGTLFDAIAHGDEAHRTWLREAIAAHFANCAPAPEPGEASR